MFPRYTHAHAHTCRSIETRRQFVCQASRKANTRRTRGWRLLCCQREYRHLLPPALIQPRYVADKIGTRWWITRARATRSFDYLHPRSPLKLCHANLHPRDVCVRFSPLYFVSVRNNTHCTTLETLRTSVTAIWKVEESSTCLTEKHQRPLFVFVWGKLNRY